MSKLNDYITGILNFVSNNPNISENELIRHVYIDLGQRFSFDTNFFPFGINISVMVDPEDYRRCPHVYNVIKPKDGSQAYTIDLQEDMYNIQSHSFTKNFGLSVTDGKTFVISRFE